MRIKFNIGLGNNPLTKFYSDGTTPDNLQLDIFKLLMQYGYAEPYYKICEGIYNDQKEYTYVGNLWLNKGLDVDDVTEALCLTMNQECISYMATQSRLVYNPNFEGERYEFNKEFFIN
ncbi:hypothetical protein EB001_13995 [bacterium]|nr:hypothetical protein [bacterium]